MKIYKIVLGKKHAYVNEARLGGYVGVGFFKDIDLSNDLVDNWKDFNKKFIPKYLEIHPEKTKVAAGLACGMTWTLIKGIEVGDMVLCPDGERNFYVGEVVSGYEYKQEGDLSHRRRVTWRDSKISKDSMSKSLQNSLGAIATLSNVSDHEIEIKSLLSGTGPATVKIEGEEVESPEQFVLEKYLEELIVSNWKKMEFSDKYDIYEDEDGSGKQYPTDTGRIDVLAISKDKKEFLVIELKRGRASYEVVGQIQTYMGYIKEAIAEKDQKVRGIIIAFEQDTRIRQALSVAKDIDFYTYKLNFKLERVTPSA